MDNSKPASDDEESDYSYVYETDSEYEDDIAETEEISGSIRIHPVEIQPVEIAPSKEIEISSNPESDDTEQKEAEAPSLSKDQMEAMKPRLPAYITSPEPCVFSEDPCTWIAWMEDQVNKERERRMNKILCASPEPPEVELDGDDDSEKNINENSTDEISTKPVENDVADAAVEEPDIDIEEEEASTQVTEVVNEVENISGNENENQAKDSADGSSIEIVDALDEFEDCQPQNESDDDSEWEYESNDDINDDKEEAHTNNNVEQDIVNINVDNSVTKENTKITVTENNDVDDDEAVNENDAQECDKIDELDKLEIMPSTEIKEEIIQKTDQPLLKRHVSCPGPSNSSLVPDDMQRKLDFIRKKKASLGQSEGENPHTPTNSSSILLLDEETQKKLAFIRQKKLSAGQNLENATNSAAQDSTPGGMQRQLSNPEKRPQSLANDSSLDDMLVRIKTLREERKQILQDMSAIKSAMGSSPAKEYEAMITAMDDGIESGVNTPNSEMMNSFHADGTDSPLIPGALASRQSRRSFDSGIGSKSLCSIQDGSPTAELEAGKSASSSHSPAHDVQTKRKISKDKCAEEGEIFCFICGENMGKLSKGAIMHMGLEDGDPVCADALYLTDESKEKIRQIATTKSFSYEDKFEMLDTVDLETWNIEYDDIPSSDVIDKVDAFLVDVEQQKARDNEKFDAMRSGAIDDIFNEEFAELLNNRHARDNHVNHEELPCDALAQKIEDTTIPAVTQHSTLSSHGPQAPPPPPPPPQSSLPSRSSPINIPLNASSSLSTSVLDSIKQGSPHLKHTETVDKSEIKLGLVIHRHLAPVVFNRDVRSLVRDIAKASTSYYIIN